MTATAEVVPTAGFDIVVSAATAAGRATATTGVIAASAEHAEVAGDNLKAGAFLAFLVLPFPRLDTAFNENEGALFQILLSDFGLLAPHDDFVPFGTLLAFTVFVFIRFIGGHGKIGDSL